MYVAKSSDPSSTFSKGATFSVAAKHLDRRVGLSVHLSVRVPITSFSWQRKKIVIHDHVIDFICNYFPSRDHGNTLVFFIIGCIKRWFSTTARKNMHGEMKMTLHIDKNMVYVQQHCGVVFCKYTFFPYDVFKADMGFLIFKPCFYWWCQSWLNIVKTCAKIFAFHSKRLLNSQQSR